MRKMILKTIRHVFLSAHHSVMVPPVYLFLIHVIIIAGNSGRNAESVYRKARVAHFVEYIATTRRLRKSGAQRAADLNT